MMIELLTLLAGALMTLIVGVLVMPAFSLLTLVFAAGLKAKNTLGGDVSAQMSVAILVPAHNESAAVVPTIENLLPQLAAQDRLLVVADNCTDDTAQQARLAGASVVERFDSAHRGKGYALAFGVDALRDNPPDVLMVIDADCQVTGAGVRRVAAQALASGHPVQMLDLMMASPEASLRTRILAFAWLMKNLVRPRGTQNLGRACHLMGTGMAFPWQIISTANLATGHVAEDMKLGVDFTLAGLAPQFSEAACVVSWFPDRADVARTQKSRWEHGHLQTMREELPRLIRSGLCQPNRATWALIMDLMVPPVAFYVLLVMGVLGLSLLLGALIPSLWPAAMIAILGLTALVVSVLTAWWRYGQHLVRLRELLTIPLYLLWKIPLYVAYFARRHTGWVRTSRD